MKTAISIPDDLYQAVIKHAAGKKFSTTVCDLIREALGIEVVPGKSDITETSIYEQLRELTTRIEAIEQRGVILIHEPVVTPGTAPDSIPEVIPAMDRLTFAKPVSLSSTDSEKSLALMASESTNQDRIILTDDMKIDLANRVKRAMESGRKYAEISTITGVSESTLKKAKSNILGTTINKAWYDAIMSL